MRLKNLHLKYKIYIWLVWKLLGMYTFMIIKIKGFSLLYFTNSQGKKYKYVTIYFHGICIFLARSCKKKNTSLQHFKCAIVVLTTAHNSSFPYCMMIKYWKNQNTNFILWYFSSYPECVVFIFVNGNKLAELMDLQMESKVDVINVFPERAFSSLNCCINRKMDKYVEVSKSIPYTWTTFLFMYLFSVKTQILLHVKLIYIVLHSCWKE